MQPGSYKSEVETMKLSREEAEEVLHMIDKNERSGELKPEIAELMRLFVLQKYGQASMKLLKIS